MTGRVHPQRIQGIAEIKFLLILGVVMQHCNYILGYPEFVENYPGSLRFLRLLVYKICDASVPCFFMISGFLFFNGIGRFTATTYYRKLKSRFHTLFIPYMFWNAVCCGAFLYTSISLGNDGCGVFTADGSVDWRILLKGFWLSPQSVSFPYAFAFWFIRNLMVFVVLSPLIWIICRRMWLTLVFVVAFECFRLDRIVPFSGMIWFVAGAFLVYHRQLIPPLRRKYFFMALIPFVVLVAARRWIDCDSLIFLVHDSLFIVIMYMVCCAGKFLKRKFGHSRLFRFVISSTFVIYATHQCYSKKLTIFLTDHIGGGFPLAPIAIYVLCVSIMLAVGLVINYFLRRFAPRFCNFITGGR